MAKRYIIMDSNKDRANRLMEMMREIDRNTGFMYFSNLLDLQTNLQNKSNFQGVLGAVIRYENNLKESLSVIDIISKISPQIYSIVVADKVNLEVLKNLIQLGVSQVMTSPIYAENLKNKMQMAEEFQKTIVNEKKEMPSYRPFRFWHEVDSAGNNAAYIVGWLADRCELPQIIPNKRGSKIIIDLDLMDGISSIGVRSWMLWMKELHANGFGQIIFKNLRHFIITQANNISGFMPATSYIQSFYLRYFNEVLDKELEILYQRDADFNDKEMAVPLYVKLNDSIENSLFSLEDPIEKLTFFFKGQFKKIDNPITRADRKMHIFN